MKFYDSSDFNIESLGKGTYGSVYHYQNKAIKKYHPIIYKYSSKNPCLRLNRKKFQLMKLRAKKIKHTFLVEDLLYINETFSGVVYPYIEGSHLGTIVNTLSIHEKQILGKQLIRNAKELTDNNIYPKDYRLPNILRDSQGNIKIIDTDDVHTKVTLFPNPLYLLLSLNSLKKAVVDLIEDEDYFNDTKSMKLYKYTDTLKIINNPFVTYQSLNNYVNEKTKPFKTIFINVEDAFALQNLNIENIFNLKQKTNSQIIIIISQYNQKILNDLLDKNIPIYDYIDVKKNNIQIMLNDYLSKYNIVNPLLMTSKKTYDIDAINKSVRYLNESRQIRKIKTL